MQDAYYQLPYVHTNILFPGLSETAPATQLTRTRAKTENISGDTDLVKGLL